MAGYGIVGCGYAGEIHGETIEHHLDGRLAAVYDTDRGRTLEFAQRWGARAAGSLEDLCADPEIDAVIITTPNHSHVEPALCAIAHRKHIFCEKPVALSFHDTCRVIKAAENADLICFSGHVSNFIRGVQTARQLMAEGAIGKLLMIEAVHTDWAGPQKTVGWKQMKQWSGGHLYHHMHEVDLICQLAGLPDTVFAFGDNLAHRGAGFGDEDDAVMVLMELPQGGLASLTIGSAFHAGDHVIKLQGEDGGIVLDFKRSFVSCVNREEVRQFGLQENELEDMERREGYIQITGDSGKGFGKPGMRSSVWMSSIFRKELECFDHYIRTGRIDLEFTSLVDGTAAMNCLKVLDGVGLSIAQKRPVRLREVL